MRATTLFLLAMALRDFRRSGSPDDWARFRLLRQQFHSTVRSSKTHFWNEWLGSVTSVSRRAPRLLCSLIRRTYPVPLLSLLTFATCNGMALPVLPSLLMRRVPNGAPIFSSTNSKRSCFLTTSSTHSLSALRLSRPCTNLADLMLPSLTTNSLLHSLKCHESAPGADCLPYSDSSKSLSHGGVIFCFPSLTSFCASLWFCLEVQSRRPGHQARW